MISAGSWSFGRWSERPPRLSSSRPWSFQQHMKTSQRSTTRHRPEAGGKTWRNPLPAVVDQTTYLSLNIFLKHMDQFNISKHMIIHVISYHVYKYKSLYVYNIYTQYRSMRVSPSVPRQHSNVLGKEKKADIICTIGPKSWDPEARTVTAMAAMAQDELVGRPCSSDANRISQNVCSTLQPLLVKSPLIAGSIFICCWLISRGSHFLVAISFVNVQVTPFIPFILAGYISHYFYNVRSPWNPSVCCLYQIFPSRCPVPTLPGHIFFHLPALGPGEADEGWHERHSMQHVPWRP